MRNAARVAAAGAKLFYLSGMRNGKYMKREVLNLARFISVTKFRPLSWRGAHPYLIADRFEVQDISVHRCLRTPHSDRHVLLTQRFGSRGFHARFPAAAPVVCSCARV